MEKKQLNEIMGLPLGGIVSRIRDNYGDDLSKEQFDEIVDKELKGYISDLGKEIMFHDYVEGDKESESLEEAANDADVETKLVFKGTDREIKPGDYLQLAQNGILRKVEEIKYPNIYIKGMDRLLELTADQFEDVEWELSNAVKASIDDLDNLMADRKARQDAKYKYKYAQKKLLASENLNEEFENEFAAKAWELNEIISHLNNEEAYYSGWLYIWPDGETEEDCNYDFGDEDSYKDLENSFINHYKAYHDDGLYAKDKRIIDNAHEWDKKLGLEPIKVLGLNEETLDETYVGINKVYSKNRDNLVKLVKNYLTAGDEKYIKGDDENGYTLMYHTWGPGVKPAGIEDMGALNREGIGRIRDVKDRNLAAKQFLNRLNKGLGDEKLEEGKKKKKKKKKSKKNSSLNWYRGFGYYNFRMPIMPPMPHHGGPRGPQPGGPKGPQGGPAVPPPPAGRPGPMGGPAGCPGPVCEEAQNKHTYNQLALLEQEIYTLLNGNGVGVEDMSTENTADKKPDTFELNVRVDGDWKHDHLRCDYLVREWCDQKDFEILSAKEQQLSDTGRDDAESIHTYWISMIRETPFYNL